MNDIYAKTMGAFEFLYDFIEVEEFLRMKDLWVNQSKSKDDPYILVYSDKVIIWII